MSQYKYGIRNENKLVRKLSERKFFDGLSTVSGSGNQAHRKEDLVSPLVLIQVKSTKKDQVMIIHLDMRKLEANAAKSGKIPIFAVYLSIRELLFLLVRVEDFYFLQKENYISTFYRNSGDVLRVSKLSVDDRDCSSIILKGQEYRLLNETDFI